MVGDASQLPELTLNIGGRPSSKTSFGTDLIVWNQNNGNFDYYRNLQLGINLYCNINLDHGDLNIKTGGIHWHEISPLTLGSFFDTIVTVFLNETHGILSIKILPLDTKIMHRKVPLIRI